MTQDLSLGELQSLCTRAARGAGRAVGVAEDAGHVVRWLTVRGEDGAGALVRLLTATDGFCAGDMIPDLPAFAPKRQAICPLALGGYLSDVGDLPEGPIGPVWAPILLLPFLAELAPNGVEIAPEAVNDPTPLRLIRREAPRVISQARACVAPETFETLLAFAARTYAPATAQSRAGAGAGVSDND
ncbi:DUF3726 domain-containing protein [Rhodobacteraceae bacterium N5(2021)]|uniref:DUF3726 domain-containing protein n=1 Tax=Gymnodinialimonas phycosphaerae TaxID=2841589 RepID=A0A975TV25_9RHOB|nr:DUF3726 domain-containing protein [Gymnodinialimonas phycosphaerae]